MTVLYRLSPAINDRALSEFHDQAFGESSRSITPWSAQLERRSLLWVTAEHGLTLVGFVNVIGDGGAHAFLLDTVVSPDRQGEGIGRQLVKTAAVASLDRGCQWLHVDFEKRSPASTCSPADSAARLRVWSASADVDRQANRVEFRFNV